MILVDEPPKENKKRKKVNNADSSDENNEKRKVLKITIRVLCQYELIRQKNTKEREALLKELDIPETLMS